MYGGAEKTMNAVAASDATSQVMPIRAPDQITVIYPYLVDGQEVRSTNGDPIGMNVTVNLRTNTISGVWGIGIQSFDKSSYATEQDTKRIMSFVERGGLYGSADMIPNTKTVDVELGKPSIGLASFGHSTLDGRWEELYVPSLIFPVVKKPADAPWLQNNVVVPLIKDLLQEPNQPVPVPMMKGGVGGGASGSSGSAVASPPSVQIAPAPAKR